MSEPNPDLELHKPTCGFRKAMLAEDVCTEHKKLVCKKCVWCDCLTDAGFRPLCPSTSTALDGWVYTCDEPPGHRPVRPHMAEDYDERDDSFREAVW